MILNVMRHARVEFGKGQPKMAERHITPEAARWVRISVGGARRELGLNPDWVLSSPLLRAKETAEIVAKTLGKTSKLSFDDSLLGETDVKTLYLRLRELKRDDSVLLVSHFPLIGNVVDDLLGGTSNVGIYSGSIACIQCESYPGKRKGMLTWLFPPRMFFDGKNWLT